MLEPRTLFTRWKNMFNIMTRSTKSDAVGYFYPKFRSFFPGFYVMNNKKSRLKFLTTLLTSVTISFKAYVSPLKVRFSPEATFKATRLNLLLSSLCFCGDLRGYIRLITTRSRTEPAFMSVILIGPKRFSTSFTIFIESRLFHGIILSQGTI